MQSPRVISMLRIALLFFFLVFLASQLSAHANQLNPCRKAVVVYLDVSGSMYEKRHMVEAPDKPGQKKTLMEATVIFLEELFTNEVNKVIETGDFLEIRQFYSRVAPLIEPIQRFDLAKHAKLIRKISQRLDHNNNKVFDLNDSNRSPALDPTVSVKRTNFENLVNDMNRIRTFTPLEGADGFHRLVFIIFTDGGHDATTAKQFETTIEAIGQKMKEDITAGRIKVMLFSLGYLRQGVEEYDITPSFQKHLHAGHLSMTPETLDFASIRRKIITGLRDRSIEIDDIKTPSWNRRIKAYEFEVTFANHACTKQSLEKIEFVLTKSPDSLDETKYRKLEAKDFMEALFRQTYPVSGELAPARTEGYSHNLTIPFPSGRLDPGRYRLYITAYTKGSDQIFTERIDFSVSPTKHNHSFWILLGIVGGIILFIIIVLLIFFRKRR